MEVYIARQPIFDRQHNIFGYQLLYRQNDLKSPEGIGDDQSTAELIYNTFLVMGLKNLTGGSKAFIKFSKELMKRDVALLLPKKEIVVEISGRDAVTQTAIESCKRLKSLDYMIALDLNEINAEMIPLIEIADIIKIDFAAIDKNVQLRLVKKYKNQVRFLAEKIETREDYQLAAKMGYDYFQGYFFCKPAVLNTKEIVTINSNLFAVLNELKTEEPNFAAICDIIQKDLGLTYKLLMLANTVKFGARNPIRSIPHALSYIGTNELYQWISLIMLKDMDNIENSEIVKLSLIRGKLMELIAHELRIMEEESEYFLTGMFSFMDVLLNKNMETVLAGLPLSIDIKKALLDRDNQKGRILDFVIDYENARWDKIINQYPINQIGEQVFLSMYMEALSWAMLLNY